VRVPLGIPLKELFAPRSRATPVSFAQGENREYASTIPSGDKAVQQIVESLTNAGLKLAHDYGLWVVAGVLALVGVGVALRVLGGVLRRRAPGQGK
jgi:hypothetical protein